MKISNAIQRPTLITHIRGSSNYSWLSFSDGQKMLIAKSLCYFESRLPGFLRIHKTVLVNPKYIRAVQAPPRSKMAGAIELTTGETLPISRRRWLEVADVLPASLQTAYTPGLTEKEEVPQAVSRPSAGAPAPVAEKRPQRQIFVVTGDDLKALLMQQVMEENWPQHSLSFFGNGNALKKAMATKSDSELPTLLIVDGRADQMDGLTTLRFIKGNDHFRLIPTVLMVYSYTGQLVEQGYELGANSVIRDPADYNHFSRTVEKICRYWLNMAAVPQLQA